MKRNVCAVLALAALVLTAGCKKSVKSSVSLTNGAKASFDNNPDWQQPTVTGRVTRLDINDGQGADCLFAYDIATGKASLTKVSATGSTTLYSDAGFQLDNGGGVSVSQFNSDCSDYYNEVGGVHVIPYDANATGHEDHLLMYIPLREVVYLFHWNPAVGKFHLDWSSATGIGGYNLAGVTDKIITYDYGIGYKKALICYRPGYGNFWVIENTGNDANVNWVARVQSSNGIPTDGTGLNNYDLRNVDDQLIAFASTWGEQMQLIAYRPGVGTTWIFYHYQNSPFFPATWTNPSGFLPYNYPTSPSFSMGSKQNRAVPFTASWWGGGSNDNQWLTYSPGAGMSYSIVWTDNPDPHLASTNIDPTISYPMNHNPYGGGPGSGIGDHVLPISLGEGNTSLLFYSNGGGNQSQIYEGNLSTNTYIQRY